jgi:hypothetical protein
VTNLRVEPTRVQELAVLQSVVYASLFDYPLTLEQLHRSLIGVRADRETIAAWWRSSDLLQATVEYRDGWFFPAGRADVIATRARRERVSRQLLDRDRRTLSMLSRIPFVRMIALSGSLAHLNAEGSADLDLFMITAPNRVWSVTVVILVLSRLMGWRRHLCLNYVVSERRMKIVPEDLFTANQIIHLKPMFGARVFDRFVKANGFVRVHYPNFERPAAAGVERRASIAERLLSLGVAQLSERVARRLYGWHLGKKAASWQSRDEVRLETECLKLHTSSHRAATLARFERAICDALEKQHDDTKRRSITIQMPVPLSSTGI